MCVNRELKSNLQFFFEKLGLILENENHQRWVEFKMLCKISLFPWTPSL